MQLSNKWSGNTMKKQTFGVMITTLRKKQGMTQLACSAISQFSKKTRFSFIEIIPEPVSL